MKWGFLSRSIMSKYFQEELSQATLNNVPVALFPCLSKTWLAEQTPLIKKKNPNNLHFLFILILKYFI